MKTRKKIVSILLVFMLLISLMPTALAAESSYQDTSGHWAEAAIERWSDYGIIQGNNGQFSPNGSLTRAHMAAVLSRLLNLPEAPNAGFSDVKDGDWYADYINRCAAAGIMLGSNGKANPNAPITRQDAIVMMARALGIKPVENPDLSHFQDGSKVSDYAKGYVAAMNKAGIVGGVTTDTLAGGSDITRAATVTILNRAITTYANEPGATVTATGSGIVLIAADNVTVTGKADSVLVSEGVASGNVTLKDVTVTGTVTVKAEDASVAVAGKSSVGEVNVAAAASGTSIAVEKNATVSTITTEAPKTSLDVSGKVGTVTVSDTADSTSIKANSGATISSVDNAADGITVSGTGKVENVTTSGNNATINTPGTKVEAAEGTTGTTAGGKDVAGGSTIETKPSTPSGGGGGGGGNTTPSHSHTYASDWSYDATNHWHASTCGHDVKTGEAAHSGGTATCTAKAVCEVCGQEYGNLAAHSGGTATCTAKAVCEVCGQEYGNLAAHTLTLVAQVDATCTVGGKLAHDHCSVCNKNFINGEGKTDAELNISAIGHSWDGSADCYNCDKDTTSAMKFELAVKSGGEVKMVVFDDYSFRITVPKGDVNTNSLTVTAAMQNVGSLGVGEKREHSVTIGDTGIGDHTVALKDWLGNAWSFGEKGDETSNTTVEIVVDGKPCSYVIFNKDTEFDFEEGVYSDYATIWGVPADIEATRDAWQALIGDVEDRNIQTSTGEDDSYIVIANGSYLVNGSEKLEFETENDLMLDDFNDLSALKQNIKDNVVLNTVADEGTIVAHLVAGTELKVSSSSAVLLKDATITIGTTVEDALADIRTASDGSTADLVKTLVQMVNDLMGSVQGATIHVTVEFN